MSIFIRQHFEALSFLTLLFDTYVHRFLTTASKYGKKTEIDYKIIDLAALWGGILISMSRP